MSLDLKTSISINDYNYADNLIAEQKEAKVYKAVHMFNKDSPALAFKGYPEKYLSEEIKELMVTQELSIMWKLKGKDNIVQILSQHMRDRMIFIIMELCQGGDLQKLIKKKGAFPEQQAISFIKQIINGYRYINQMKVIHRLLEPSNILIADLQLKIGDFSQAIYCKQAPFAKKKEQLVGMHSYQAPEVLQHYSYSNKSDVYSIGLIFLSMLRGTQIFSGQTKYQILNKMKETNISQMIGNDLSLKTRHFLIKALNPEVDKRMDVAQMVDYNFDMIPKLTLNKFLSFNNPKETINMRQESLKSEQTQKDIKSQFSGKHLEEIKQVFGDASPIKARKQTKLMTHLKVSQEFDTFKSSKDMISLIIPSKTDVMEKQKNKNDMFKLFQVESNVSYECQGSLLQPLEKEQSNKSGTSKNSKKNGVLKKSQFPRQKLEAEKISKIDKPPPSLYSHDSFGMVSKQQSSPTPLQKSQNKTASLELTKASPTLQPQYISNPPQKNVKLHLPIMESPMSKKTSAISGRSNFHNESVIEVNVHSPQKRMSSSRKSKMIISECDVLANLLLSLVDMSRYLSRVCFRLNKIDGGESRLNQGLLGLRIKLLNMVRRMDMLQPKEKEVLYISSEFSTLLQIVEKFQQKYVEQGYQQALPTLKQLIGTRIHSLFSKLSQDRHIQSFQVKLLNQLIQCWRMVGVLEERDIKVFYNTFNFEELLLHSKKEVKILDVIDLHERMKEMNIVPS